MVDISALKKEYPWFSVLYQLEAKCLKNDNKFGLKKSIKTASLFTGDREVLYNFMHDAISFGNLTAAETLSPVKPIEKKDSNTSDTSGFRMTLDQLKNIKLKKISNRIPPPFTHMNPFVNPDILNQMRNKIIKL